MTKIKICGLSREEDIAAVNRYRPDYIGFVLAPGRRCISPDQARRLKRGLDRRIQAVGVFVNQDIDLIAALCADGILDLVQLHGDEDGAYLQALKKSIDCPVIKAVRIQAAGPPKLAEAASGADLLLFDTYHPDQFGGSGQAFDWSLIPTLAQPFFLAGGLNPTNLARALEMVRPYGVDISSGAETDGYKDENKIRELIAITRATP